jgi:hypothetical protein
MPHRRIRDRGRVMAFCGFVRAAVGHGDAPFFSPKARQPNLHPDDSDSIRVHPGGSRFHLEFIVNPCWELFGAMPGGSLYTQVWMPPVSSTLGTQFVWTRNPQIRPRI